MENRIIKAREAMISRGLDAYLLQSRENKLYLSGLNHIPADERSISLLFLTKRNCYFFVSAMEAEPAKQKAPLCEIIPVERDDTSGSLIASVLSREAQTGKAKAAALAPIRIGYEQFVLKHEYANEISATLRGTEFVPVQICEDMRLIKSDDEVDLIEASMDIAVNTVTHIAEYIRPGMTERDIAWEAERFARGELGADELSFPTIVASGLNSANPHNVPSMRKIEHGDLVTLDFGVMKDGYASDITRTFAIGDINNKQREIYDAVLAANEAAYASAKPGIKAVDLDAVARSLLEERGFGEYFVHSLGHGIGLEVHENPSISPSGDMSLIQGMVFSIEPGVYIPDFCGVRIEDSVIMTEDGVRNLTNITKDLITI